MNKHIYKAEEIFQEIPDDPDNVIMTIPPEILETQGWKEGDTLVIKIEEGSLVLQKQENE
jgi:formylmethanofuran dehydrogenase subunit D